MLLRSFLERLRRPDAVLEQDLRRLTAITVLASLCGAVLLFLLFALSLTAPHPLSLFLTDLVALIPPVSRVLAAGALAFLLLLLCLRIVVHAAVRRGSR